MKCCQGTVHVILTFFKFIFLINAWYYIFFPHLLLITAIFFMFLCKIVTDLHSIYIYSRLIDSLMCMAFKLR